MPKYWVKIGNQICDKVECEGDISDLRRAIKNEFKNRFLSVDPADIVVKSHNGVLLMPDTLLIVQEGQPHLLSEAFIIEEPISVIAANNGKLSSTLPLELFLTYHYYLTLFWYVEGGILKMESSLLAAPQAGDHIVTIRLLECSANAAFDYNHPLASLMTCILINVHEK